MTCKDCLHCEACTDMVESLGYTGLCRGIYTDGKEAA